jgi:hypothetical protein
VSGWLLRTGSWQSGCSNVGRVLVWCAGFVGVVALAGGVWAFDPKGRQVTALDEQMRVTVKAVAKVLNQVLRPRR